MIADNKFSKIILAISLVVRVFLVALLIPGFLFLFFSIYRSGYFFGFKDGQINAERYYLDLINQIDQEMAKVNEKKTTTVQVTPSLAQKPKTTPADWGGPQLWEEVNKRRQELGVNPLSPGEELCTIASIRLNELLELGKLDSHKGFSDLQERRSDLRWIFDKYSTIAEFLAYGGKSAKETVSLWENTLGHKKLLSGGEYVWGCIYAQNSFSVAITAF